MFACHMPDSLRKAIAGCAKVWCFTRPLWLSLFFRISLGYLLHNQSQTMSCARKFQFRYPTSTVEGYNLCRDVLARLCISVYVYLCIFCTPIFYSDVLQ